MLLNVFLFSKIYKNIKSVATSPSYNFFHDVSATLMDYEYCKIWFWVPHYWRTKYSIWTDVNSVFEDLMNWYNAKLYSNISRKYKCYACFEFSHNKWDWDNHISLMSIKILLQRKLNKLMIMKLLQLYLLAKSIQLLFINDWFKIIWRNIPYSKYLAYSWSMV